MAGSSPIERWDYVGDGKATSFAFRVPIRMPGELVVYVGDALKRWPDDYAVAGAGDAQGGSVEFGVAPAPGTPIAIERRAPQESAAKQVAAALAAAGALLTAADAHAAIAVADHGAKGDGTTDDTDAIAAAEAARRPGQTLHFAAGTYLSRGNAVAKPGIWAFDPGATFRLADRRPAGTKLLRIESDDVVLRGGTFDGNRARQSAPSAQNAIHGIGRRNVHIDIDRITGAGAEGVYMADATDCSVRVRQADHTGLSAIQWYYTGTRSVTRCVTHGSTVDRADDAANLQGCIKYSKSGDAIGRIVDCAVVDCHARMHPDATGYGAVCIEFWGAGAYNRVAGCHVEGGVIGISIANGQTSGDVAGCTSADCAFEGIEIADSTHCTVSGNVVDGNDRTQIGFSIDGRNIPAISNSVTGNAVRSTTLSGITFYLRAKNSVACGNTVDFVASDAFGIRVLAASGVAISGNAIDGKGSGGFGIVVDKASDVTLTGNNIVDTAQQAVQVINDRPGTVDNVAIVGGLIDRTAMFQFIASGGGEIGPNCRHQAVTGWTVGMTSGGKAHGDVFDWAGFRGDFRGRGADPEGELAAGIGSTYRRLDGPPGHQLWLKESGSGPTGWRRVSYRLSTEAVVTAAALAAGPVVIVPAIPGARFRLREIVLTGVVGLAGGDRTVRIRDASGGTVWSSLSADAVRGNRPRFWGDPGVPIASAAAVTATSAAGEPIVAAYADGTADYVSGSIGLVVEYERVP